MDELSLSMTDLQAALPSAGTFILWVTLHCHQLKMASLAATQCFLSQAALLFSSSLITVSGLNPSPDKGPWRK